MTGIVWIAVDWGTSNLRVWAIDARGAVVAESTSDKGMAKLDQAGFEPALLDLIDGWLAPAQQTPVVACGMVGARQGWVEVPYRQAPCKPVFSDLLGRPQTCDPRLNVIVLPGIKQIEPADVMRGEETQIAGVLLDRPDFDGVLCLPGTHTKWVRISAGEIVAFKTFMTGEMFGLLGESSVLRHSLGGGTWNDAEFATTVSAVAADPAGFAGQLFSIRAATLVSGLDASTARARLSGILIGAELAAAKSYWQDQRLIVVGSGAQSGIYAQGLRALGQSPDIVDTAHVTLAGLKAAWIQIGGDFR